MISSKEPLIPRVFAILFAVPAGNMAMGGIPSSTRRFRSCLISFLTVPSPPATTIKSPSFHFFESFRSREAWRHSNPLDSRSRFTSLVLYFFLPASGLWIRFIFFIVMRHHAKNVPRFCLWHENVEKIIGEYFSNERRRDLQSRDKSTGKSCAPIRRSARGCSR